MAIDDEAGQSEINKHNERLDVKSVSIRSKNGVLSHKERMVNGHTTKANNN